MLGVDWTSYSAFKTLPKLEDRIGVQFYCSLFTLCRPIKQDSYVFIHSYPPVTAPLGVELTGKDIIFLQTGTKFDLSITAGGEGDIFICGVDNIKKKKINIFILVC